MFVHNISVNVHSFAVPVPSVREMLPVVKNQEKLYAKFFKEGAGAKAQQLKALAILAEELVFVLSTHMAHSHL